MNSDQFSAIYGAILELKSLARVFLNMSQRAQDGARTYTCDTESSKRLLNIAIAADAALDDLQRTGPADEQKKSEVSA